jgi:hypothetical protein
MMKIERAATSRNVRRPRNHRNRILLLRNALHRAASERKQTEWKKQANLPKHPHRA